jgi:WD40 repeat protein
MFSKKLYFFAVLLFLPSFFISAQTTQVLKSKIKLDTSYNHGSDVYVLVSADGYIAFGDELGEVTLIDQSGKLIKTPVKHTGWVNAIAYNLTKKLLVSGGSDGKLNFLNLESNEIVRTLSISEATISQIRFLSDSQLLVSSDKLYLINVDDGKTINSFSETKQISCFAVDADKKTAYLGFEDGKISVFDINKFKSGKTLIKHQSKVTAIALSNDGKELVSGDNSGTFVIWETKNFKPKKMLKAHSDVLSSIAFSEDNKYLVTAGYDKNVFVWNRKDYKLELNVNAHINIVTSVLFANGKFVTAGFDNTIKIWKNF